MNPGDLLNQRPPLGLAVGEDHIVVVDPDTLLVRRHHHHPKIVEVSELRGGGARGGGHPAQTRVGAQEVVHGDGAEDPPLLLELQAFLGFDGRLEAIRPLPVLGDPAGEIVHQLHPLAPHDVVAVSFEEVEGVEGVSEIGEQLEVGRCRRDCRSPGTASTRADPSR